MIHLFYTIANLFFLCDQKKSRIFAAYYGRKDLGISLEGVDKVPPNCLEYRWRGRSFAISFRMG